MKIPLKELDKIKSQEFLKYFLAQLRKKNHCRSASSQFNDLSQFETSTNDFLLSNIGEKIEIEWKITQNEDGTIPYVEVIAVDFLDLKEYSDQIYSFIKEVLLLAYSEEKKTFYNRQLFCFINSTGLNGEYWIGSKTRIAPLYPDDRSQLINAERILVVDQLIEAIDQQYSMEIGDEQALLLSAQLSFILNIGIYKPINESRYFIKDDDMGHHVINERVQLSIWDDKRTSEMPRKGKTCKPMKPSRSISENWREIGDVLNLPEETRKIFKSLENADLKNQRAFNNCCRLWQTALNAGRYHPTIRFSYMYGAVDAIVQATGVSGDGFRAFVRNYYSSVDEDLLEHLDRKVRCAHLHGGEFSLGDHASVWGDRIFNPTYHNNHVFMRKAERTIRQTILNWIFKEILKETPKGKS